MEVKVNRSEEEIFVKTLFKLNSSSDHIEHFSEELYDAFYCEGYDNDMDVSNDKYIETFWPIVITFIDANADETSNITEFYDWYWEEYKNVKNDKDIISVNDFINLVDNFINLVDNLNPKSKSDTQSKVNKESLGAHLRNLLTPYKNLLQLVSDVNSGKIGKECLEKFKFDNIEDLISFSKSKVMEETIWEK